jgi:hypothetical protein
MDSAFEMPICIFRWHSVVSLEGFYLDRLYRAEDIQFFVSVFRYSASIFIAMLVSNYVKQNLFNWYLWP